MKEKLEQMRAEALAALADKGLDPESLRIRFLGKKGELTALLRSMGELSPEERPAAATSSRFTAFSFRRSRRSVLPTV